MATVLTEKTPDRRVPSLRGLLACFGIVCLTVTLANRTVHISASEKVTVSSVSAAKIQHRDKDSSEWVCPLVALPMLWVPEASYTHHPSDRELLDLHYESLHNPEMYNYDIAVQLSCDVYTGRYQSDTEHLPSALEPDHAIEARVQKRLLYVKTDQDRVIEMRLVGHRRAKGDSCPTKLAVSTSQ